MDEPRERTSAPRGTFAALSYPNYRLWFFGQMVSLFGTWMQNTALGYLVYELTRSPAYLGYTGFASGLASWLFTLWGGVIADRVPRRSLLVVTQTLAMLLAFVLSALAFAGVVAPWQIILFAFLLGVVNAFDAPARQAFVLEMVDRSVLTNAIALNSTMFNIAIAVGPAAGGIVYALFGPAWCFAINGASFVAVIAALLAMRLPPLQARAGGASALADLREGFRTVAGNRVILALIALIGVMSLFGLSFATLIPAWAVKILGGDARTNGLLQSARGLGALAAALWIATFGGRVGRGEAPRRRQPRVPRCARPLFLYPGPAAFPADARRGRGRDDHGQQSVQLPRAGPDARCGPRQGDGALHAGVLRAHAPGRSARRNRRGVSGRARDHCPGRCGDPRVFRGHRPRGAPPAKTGVAHGGRCRLPDQLPSRFNRRPDRRSLPAALAAQSGQIPWHVCASCWAKYTSMPNHRSSWRTRRHQAHMVM